MNYKGILTDENTGDLSFTLRPQNEDERAELKTMAERGVSIEIDNSGKAHFLSKRKKKQAKPASTAKAANNSTPSEPGGTNSL